ncbi:SDR family NAD(P)-dependent oxidoreductase [Limnohabitans sp.]|uniref:SDR family NAD(P)-dependent oxidoreductase n=1 Tax=Limnohabitans sp. TaxID=1907725 RepID=UPI002AFE769C|nr:SDR family NAD(P)-dependent oxidoreductase [Limnohabitans sp.]
MAALRKINLQDGVAVVTGAAGGIGAALALQLAEKGCHLALADVNGAGLAEVAAKAQAYDVKVSTLVLDMGQAESAQGLLDHVRAHHGRATVLINNAGVALGGQFEQVSEEDFDWLMSINFGAVVRLTRVFLPLLQQSQAAQIVNMSSIFGIIAPPGQTAYSAAKFAVRGFSEALRHELEAGNSSVRMTLLHPGGVRTGIATSARLPASVTAQEIKLHQKNWQKALRLSPEAAARRILRGIERREPRVLVGDDAVAASWIQRLLPVTYWRWVARGMSRSFRDAV